MFIPFLPACWKIDTASFATCLTFKIGFVTIRTLAISSSTAYASLSLGMLANSLAVTLTALFFIISVIIPTMLAVATAVVMVG